MLRDVSYHFNKHLSPVLCVCIGWTLATTTAALVPTSALATRASVTSLTSTATVTGAAYAWGGGPLGDGTTNASDVPVPVSMPAGISFTAISGGYSHSLALASNGAAYAWGDNGSGELGDGTTASSTTPVPVSMPAGVTFTAIATGTEAAHSLALASNGVAYAWGSNDQGQLGDGATGGSNDTPVAVNMPAGVAFTAVAAGSEHSIGLASNGSVYAWGNNSDGELGDGTTGGSSDIPVPVNMPVGVTFTAVAAGYNRCIALASNGAIYAWGYGAYSAGSTIPVAMSMPAGVTFTAITAGVYHSMALASDGSAYAWGLNLYGDLGNVGRNSSSNPIPVSMPSGVRFTAIAAGAVHSIGIASNGASYAWGYNADGELGDGTTINRDTPVAVNMPAGVTFTAIAGGFSRSLALSQPGEPVTTFQDNNPGVVYGSWQGILDATANGGTYRASETASANAIFKFSGTRISWVTRQGPDQGIASVRIDGANRGNVDLYAASVQGFSQIYSGLSSVRHTIVITVTGTKNTASTGTGVALDAFMVGSTIYQDSSTLIAYDTWGGAKSAAASGGTFRISAAKGATLSFSYAGRGVDWITATGPSYGRAVVIIDGINMGRLDLHASTFHGQVAESYSGLAWGSHTIIIIVLGTKDASSTGTKVVVDAFICHS